MTDLEWISQRVTKPSQFSIYYKQGNKLVCTGHERDIPKGVLAYTYEEIIQFKIQQDTFD